MGLGHTFLYHLIPTLGVSPGTTNSGKPLLIRFKGFLWDSCGILWEWASRYAIQDPLWMLAHTSRFTKASTLQCVETLTWSVGLWYRCVYMHAYMRDIGVYVWYNIFQWLDISLYGIYIYNTFYNYLCTCMWNVYMWIFVCVKHVEDTVTMIKVGKSWSSRVWQVGWLVLPLQSGASGHLKKGKGERTQTYLKSQFGDCRASSDMAFLHRLHPFKSPWHVWWLQVAHLWLTSPLVPRSN